MPPSKITDELIVQICDHIREGNYVESSCFACGKAKRTYYNWVKRGEEDTEAKAGTAPVQEACSCPDLPLPPA